MTLKTTDRLRSNKYAFKNFCRGLCSWNKSAEKLNPLFREFRGHVLTKNFAHTEKLNPLFREFRGSHGHWPKSALEVHCTSLHPLWTSFFFLSFGQAASQNEGTLSRSSKSDNFCRTCSTWRRRPWRSWRSWRWSEPTSALSAQYEHRFNFNICLI